MRLLGYVPLVLVFAAGTALAQDAGQEIVGELRYILNSLLLLLGGIFVWLLIFGLFLLRIDANGLRDPGDNFTGDWLAVLLAVLAYILVGYNVMYSGSWAIDGYLPASLFTPVAVEAVDVSAADVLPDAYNAIASDAFYQAAFAALVVALFAFTMSGRISRARLIIIGALLGSYGWPMMISLARLIRPLIVKANSATTSAANAA